jgi:hypothetical protein
MTVYSGRVCLITSSLLSRVSFCTRLALVFPERVRHIRRAEKKLGQIGKTGFSVDVYGFALDVKLVFVQLCHCVANINSLHVVVYQLINTSTMYILCVSKHCNLDSNYIMLTNKVPFYINVSI